MRTAKTVGSMMSIFSERRFDDVNCRSRTAGLAFLKILTKLYANLTRKAAGFNLLLMALHRTLNRSGPAAMTS